MHVKNRIAQGKRTIEEQGIEETIEDIFNARTTL